MTLPGRIAPTLERAGLRVPDHENSLGAVLLAAADAAGADLPAAEDAPGPRSGAEARALLRLPRAERVVVVLVDGLGLEQVRARRGHAPTLRPYLDGARALCSAFPSTTAASLGLLGTGCAPGLSGLVGYTARTTSGSLGNFVSWTGLGAPSTVQREPTVFERAAAAGVRVTSVGLTRFDGSGLTRAVLRGAQHVGVDDLGARADAAAHALRTPGLVYLYFGEVDQVGHHDGWQSDGWGDALADVDRALGRLLRVVPRGTLVLVTADHGMVDVDPAHRHDVASTPGLAEGVAMVAGEPRMTHLYTAGGADPGVVAERWQDILGDDAVVLTRDEAMGGGLFGPVAEHVEPTIGDLLVLATGRATVVDSRTQSPGSIGLVGVHGSLTHAETDVPYLALKV
ncbi:alkaline phosphatase family protein [Sanguibacter sp. A247]|uniref:alkaline phosphatase family protein n=1 Tax=unclassified Sanguibacter TaxID=2645534 RepID=UPI003FD845B9